MDAVIRIYSHRNLDSPPQRLQSAQLGCTVNQHWLHVTERKRGFGTALSIHFKCNKNCLFKLAKLIAIWTN